ncbi:MAG: trypsin-like peptidase domain-containing protein [Cellulomonas sp.]|nr:trypsin-like peptidase domain-containing protein [Cellulomonas sp.]
MTSTPGDETTPTPTDRPDPATTPTVPAPPVAEPSTDEVAPAAPTAAPVAQPAAWTSPTAQQPVAPSPSAPAAPAPVAPPASPYAVAQPSTPPVAPPASPYAVAQPSTPPVAPPAAPAAPAAGYAPAPAQPGPYGPFRAERPVNPFAAPPTPPVYGQQPPTPPVYGQPQQAQAYPQAAQPVQPHAVQGDPFAAPVGAGGPAAPRQRPAWVLVTVCALVSVLVAGGTTFGVLAANGTSSSTRPASISGLGQSTTSQVPVAGSSTASPDWEAVAKAVKASVVAIAVNTTEGEAEGSGVILDSEGHVLTNNHVVDGAQNNTVQVTLSDGRIVDATVVGTDATIDLAVVTITDPPSDLQPAALGDSNSLVVGEQVMAVGNPLGLQNTVTTGIVSALARPVSTATTSDGSDAVVTNAIQVDAAINPGNSGGPLFDGEGKVIGITSSIASLSSTSGGSQSGSIGLGFAIPIDLVKNIGSQLIASGSAQHAFLGVRLTDATATADGATRRGAKVASVTAGSPAAKAGIEAGDVIVALGDNPTPGSESLTAYVRSMSAGDTVTLTLVRDGKALQVDATLAAKAEDATSRPGSTPAPSQGGGRG